MGSVDQALKLLTLRKSEFTNHLGGASVEVVDLKPAAENSFDEETLKTRGIGTAQLRSEFAEFAFHGRTEE